MCNEVCAPFKALFAFLCFNAVAIEFCIGFSVSVQGLAQSNTSVLAQRWHLAWPPGLLGQDQDNFGWCCWEDGNLRWVWVEGGLLYLGILGIKFLGPELWAWLQLPVSKSSAAERGAGNRRAGALAAAALVAPLVVLCMPGPARVVLLETFMKGGGTEWRRRPRRGENKKIQLFSDVANGWGWPWAAQGRRGRAQRPRGTPCPSPTGELAMLGRFCNTRFLPVVPQDP